MTEYARESVPAVLDEIKPLLAKHWEEIATYKDMPLDPDYDAYLAADARGKVRVFTARDAGALIGYGVFFLGNLHYRSSRIATQDILFILPAYRGTTVGYRLIRFCDAQLQADGTQAVYQHVKLAHDFSPLLASVGYEPVETIHARRF
jgi:GNAT superfamily N-acetyltransferase